MGRIVINNRAKILDSTAIKVVGDIMCKAEIDNSTCEKFTDFNIGNKEYTVLSKKGVSSWIFSIEYTGYEHI